MADPQPELRGVFCEALDRKTLQERAEYLDQACGGSPELRARVEALLQAHEEASGFFQEPAGSPAGTGDDPPLTEGPGTRIGPYKLLQQIGEGGMGVVFMAEQEEPVRRKVALKIIKPGMDSKQVVARFEAERQALALMDHINIARVLDAGTIPPNPKSEARNPKQIRTPKSEFPNQAEEAVSDVDASDLGIVSDFGFRASDFVQGRPYFVMELVHGVPITKYCDENRLTPRERLELFVPVCQAIQHAHQKGIIHRDVKPSNVMVTLYDGKPVPKVIDFGVAKAIEQRLTQRTMFTQYGTMVGTLEYMSPEQAELSGLGVDTRSDVYSLGVLLYELLTGSTPLERKRLREAALDEMLRLIREEEPPKPSTRLSDSGERLASISAQRKTEPAKLAKLVRGELDWIVMKALDKDRTRRYETADGLARDVERYLADEPVEACPPSAAYKLRKFAHKNRRLLATAAAFAALLMLGAIVSLWQAVRATWEERRANHEREQAVAARQAVEQAQRDGRYQLYQARLAEAQSRRWSGRVGQRFASWKALTEAAQIARELELGEDTMLKMRNEAIACLALADVRLDKEWAGYPLGSSGSLGFDANLERYARSDGQGNISVRRMADDQELARLPGHGPEGGNVIHFSPNGDLLAVQYWRLLPQEPTNFRLWDWRRRAVVYQPSFSVDAMAFSPDGRYLALSQANGVLTLSETATGKEMRRLSLGSKPMCPVFHPDGTKLALGSIEGREVQLREVATGDLIRKLPHPTGVWQVAWHPDGNLLAAAGNDFHVYLWHVATGRQHAVLRGHQNGGVGVAFSPDGNLLLSWAWDGTSCLWDPWAGRQLVRFGGWMSHFSADGRWLASRNGTRLGLWEVTSGREYRTLPNSVGTGHRWSGSVSSPDGRWLAARGDEGVKFWDLATGKEKAFVRLGPTSRVVFHPSRGDLITSGPRGLYRWPIQVGPDSLHIGPPHRLPVPGPIHQISLDQRGRILAVSSPGGVWIVNLDEPSDKVRYFDHVNAQSVATSPDGRWVASGTHNGYGVKVWDTLHGKLERPLLPDVQVALVAFSPDGQWLATSTEDEFSLWEVGSWKPVRQISRERADGILGPMAFAADGKMLALSTARDLVQLVDPATGQAFAKLQAPNSDPIDWMSFCPDSSQLVVNSLTGDQGLIRVWDLRLIREQLKDIGLDWDLPPYPVPRDVETVTPLRVEVDLGDLAVLVSADASRRHLGLCTFVLALNPFNFQAYLRRGNTYAELGEVKNAAEDYGRSAALMPPDNRRCSARFLAAVENAESLRDYVKALADQLNCLGSDATGANNLAWQSVTGPEEARDPVKALALAELAAALRPGDGVVLNTLGVVYYRLGWFEQARATLERSLRVNCAPAHDLFFLAMCQARRGDQDKARQCYDRAVQWVEQRQGKLPAGWTEELTVFRAEAAELLGIKQTN